MSDLDTFANKFKEWRGNQRYKKYPEHFWDEIRRLEKHYSILEIAEALNISPQYLRLKFQKELTSLPFAPVTVTSFPSTVSIEFTDSACRAMIVRFEASHEQLVNMIQLLSGKTS